VVPRVILLAEDDPDHAHLVRAAFQRVAPEIPIMHVNDGEEAIAYLSGDGHYADRSKFPIPSLLLLDLKMPRIDGLEVLGWIRNSPEWRYLPITVLTSSGHARDVDAALRLGANSFLVKPHGLSEFFAAIKELSEHWLKSVTLPQFSPDSLPRVNTMPQVPAPAPPSHEGRAAESWTFPNSPRNLPSTNQQPMRIFHVNDSTDDQVLFQAACSGVEVPFNWHTTDSAETAIKYLNSILHFPSHGLPPRPELIVLDIHLGCASGFEVLKFIRSNPELRTIPVVMLSGDINPRMVREAYDLGASSFLTKPVNFEEMKSLMRSLYDFWSLMRRSQPTAS